MWEADAKGLGGATQMGACLPADSVSHGNYCEFVLCICVSYPIPLSEIKLPDKKGISFRQHCPYRFPRVFGDKFCDEFGDEFGD